MVNSNPQHNQQAPEKDVAMKDCPDQAVLWACLDCFNCCGNVPWLGALDYMQVEKAS